MSKANLTHELALASGAFALHLLADDERGLELFHVLGMRSGREGEKLADVPSHPGVTGSPVLDDAVAYFEARIVRTFDADESTLVLADVVAGRWLRDTPVLTIERARERMPPQWLAEWKRRFEAEVREARRRR